jgi:hypothetical protein
MKKKEPEPRSEYTEKQKDYAKYLLTLPSQYDLHHKPNDYLRTLQKEGKNSRSRTSASGSKSSRSRSKKRSNVPQLGQQAKQGQSLEIAQKWADEWGMSLEDVLASQNERFPKAVVAPKHKFVMGWGPLVSKERLEDLPTNMRYLHAWYMNEAKNGRIMIMARVPREYYGRPEENHVNFDELFQMYNYDTLDKSLMTCYCP